MIAEFCLFSRQYLEIFFSYSFQKTGFDISCELSPKDKCIKYQSLFLGANEEKYFQLPSALTCGASCLMSVGRVVVGRILCGASCLEAN